MSKDKDRKKERTYFRKRMNDADLASAGFPIGSGATEEAAIADLHVSADGLIADLHGLAEYRAHLVKVLTGRAVLQWRRPACLTVGARV